MFSKLASVLLPRNNTGHTVDKAFPAAAPQPKPTLNRIREFQADGCAAVEGLLPHVLVR